VTQLDVACLIGFFTGASTFGISGYAVGRAIERRRGVFTCDDVIAQVRRGQQNLIDSLNADVFHPHDERLTIRRTGDDASAVWKVRPLAGRRSERQLQVLDGGREPRGRR
jgi:hypothetical protein